MPIARTIFRTLCLTALTAVGVACQTKYPAIGTYQPSTQPLSVKGLSDPQPFDPVDAVVTPPVGWKADTLKADDSNTHQVWKSPSGNTAYGVIHFGLPLPLPASFILSAYLSEMKKSEGEASIVAGPLTDEALPGVRFTVDC